MRDGSSRPVVPDDVADTPTPGGRDGVVGTAAGREYGQAAMTAVSPACMGLVNNRRGVHRQV